MMRSFRTKKNNRRVVIGIDEVGRGALAGPVVVAAVLLGGRLQVAGGRRLGKLRDSKKLTALRREAWFKYFRNIGLRYTIARVYPRQIEKRNIARAANLAAHRAYERLAHTSHLTPLTSHIFLDGGLYLKNKDASTALRAKTVVRGDEKIPAVAVASIIAKVWRDKLMRRLAKRYLKYGFEIHKGYGTAAHFAAVRRFGASPAHRLTFIS